MEIKEMVAIIYFHQYIMGLDRMVQVMMEIVIMTILQLLLIGQ